jgi:hypothetical protein
MLRSLPSARAIARPYRSADACAHGTYGIPISIALVSIAMLIYERCILYC